MTGHGDDGLFGHQALQPSRRQFLKAATASAAAAGFAGCLGGGGGGQRPMDAEQIPPSDYADTVNVWNWYFTWRDWVTKEFNSETGVKTNTTSYSSASEFYSKFESGNHKIDNVGATTTWTKRSMDNDHIEPLPVDMMESWKAVPEYIKESTREYKSKDGDIYAMPQAVSIFPSLTYNEEVFDSPPESWSVLWDDEYAGNIFMWDAPTISCQIAAWHTGQDPFNPSDFDDIEEALKQQKPLLKTYWSEYNQARGMFVNEDVVVGPLLDGQTFMARFDNQAPINMTVPKEGTLFNVDDIIIPKGAPHPMASLYFVDWAMRPEQSRHMLTKMGYLPPVKQENLKEIYSKELESGEMTEEQLEFYQWPQEWKDRLIFGEPVEEEVRKKYDEIWTAVKAS
ncbi:ABC transporter substrate-binding protein [Haloferax sp. YSMS24]|uniref:ABC transporter substrate-binding protein n=1 Tax=unclassified Haloferax TaxID=2625095 RepID=UPI00398C883F